MDKLSHHNYGDSRSDRDSRRDRGDVLALRRATHGQLGRALAWLDRRAGTFYKYPVSAPLARWSRDGPASAGAWDMPGPNYGKVRLGHLITGEASLGSKSSKFGGMIVGQYPGYYSPHCQDA